MSQRRALVVSIKNILPHPNAERLEIALVLGWSCVVPIGRYTPGDLVVYIPVDAVLPEALSDRLGVTRYLSNGRVRAAKMRGVVSYGLVFGNEESWEEGTDVTEHYGVTKYEPPIKVAAGDTIPMHPALSHYTDLENIKNYPDVLQEGEEVIATEKIHGTNCVHAAVVEGDEVVFMAASHRHQRVEDPKSTYWRTFADASRNLLREAVQGHKVAILFKEVYGSRIQNLNYGLENQVLDVAFDLCVDGRYLDYDVFKALCDKHGVATAPLLYRGPFDREHFEVLVNGEGVSTTLGEGEHIMEGIVIKPVCERWNELTGRTILKWISDAHALNKKTTDFH